MKLDKHSEGVKEKKSKDRQRQQKKDKKFETKFNDRQNVETPVNVCGKPPWEKRNRSICKLVSTPRRVSEQVNTGEREREKMLKFIIVNGSLI